MTKLKILICAGFVVVICAGYLIYLARLGIVVKERASSEFLTVSSTLVSVATLASIGFTLLIFLETTFLSYRVDEASQKAREEHAKVLQEMSSLRDTYYSLALKSIEGLQSAFMAMPSSSEYKEVIKNLRNTLLDVHFKSGTYLGLLYVIEGLFKYNHRRFLEVESDLWDKTVSLDESKRTEVRKFYLGLKQQLLNRLGM